MYAFSYFFLCRRLHTYAEQGDFTQAEGIMRQMRETGLHPGPRAHHALIFSYVKGGNSMGALEAIQNEAQKFGESGSHVSCIRP